MFSNYGEILEVHAKKNIRLRGQAFIVCHNEETAEACIKALRGFLFFGKPLRLNFASKDSDLISKLKGTFDPEVLQKRAVYHVDTTRVRDLKVKRKLIHRLLKLRQQTASIQTSETFENRFAIEGDVIGSRTQKLVATGRIGGYQSESYKILFLENVPRNTRPEQLDSIFSQYSGFVEVRHIPEKGVAFIEFVNEDYATIALRDLQQEKQYLLVFTDSNNEQVLGKLSFGKK